MKRGAESRRHLGFVFMRSSGPLSWQPQDCFALAQRAAMTASANSPLPCLSAIIAVKTSCSPIGNRVNGTCYHASESANRDNTSRFAPTQRERLPGRLESAGFQDVEIKTSCRRFGFSARRTSE